MIFDHLSNFKQYAGAHRLFGVVAEYLEQHDLDQLPLGAHSMPDGAYLIVSEYETKAPADGFIECHRKYIDIQLLAAGREQIGVVPLDVCTADDYDEAKDFQQLHGPVEPLTLQPGYFMIFFPQDGHMPSLIAGEQQTVRKIVFKVPV
ncbi:YhcH/YjgK/YiaL family protein [Candidatus Sumerlaeota bacterium]|nr:YhcH/YjgK/YiaL family protein [Candidatus Sumerlaeota bacterium]